jgi:hypothetical protein
MGVGSNDFTTGLATYIKTTYHDSSLALWMIPRFEGPNEIFSPFYSTSYYKRLQVAWSWPNNNLEDDAYGMGASTMGQALANVWGISQGNVKTQTKYQALIGVAAAIGGANPANAALFAPRVTAAKYVTTNTPQSPYCANVGCGEAYNWNTHLVFANYVSPVYYDSQQEIQWAFDWALNGTTSHLGDYVDGLEPKNAVVTMTAGTPGVINWTAHNLSNGDPIHCDTQGVMPINPGGPSSGNYYYVSDASDPNKLKIASSAGGGSITFAVNSSGGAFARL